MLSSEDARVQTQKLVMSMEYLSLGILWKMLHKIVEADLLGGGYYNRLTIQRLECAP